MSEAAGQGEAADKPAGLGSQAFGEHSHRLEWGTELESPARPEPFEPTKEVTGVRGLGPLA